MDFCFKGHFSWWAFILKDLCLGGLLFKSIFVLVDFCFKGHLSWWTFDLKNLCLGGLSVVEA